MPRHQLHEQRSSHGARVAAELLEPALAFQSASLCSPHILFGMPSQAASHPSESVGTNRAQTDMCLLGHVFMCGRTQAAQILLTGTCVPDIQKPYQRAVAPADTFRSLEASAGRDTMRAWQRHTAGAQAGAPREPLQAVWNFASRLGQVGAASFSMF